MSDMQLSDSDTIPLIVRPTKRGATLKTPDKLNTAFTTDAQSRVAQFTRGSLIGTCLSIIHSTPSDCNLNTKKLLLWSFDVK